MRYIVGSPTEDGSKVDIELITQDPIGYASRFEPIDVVNGKMIAWSEDGSLYHFGPDKKLTASKLTANVSIVEVGKWEANEPVMIKEAPNQSEQLRVALLEFLRTEEPGSRRRLWRRKNSYKKGLDYSSVTLKELIQEASLRLGN